MALAMWAKTAAGTNFAFVKGFGKALKSFRELLQQTVIRKPAPKPKFYGHQVPRTEARDRCLFKPYVPGKSRNSLQSRVFRSLFSKSTTQQSLASVLRRRYALRLTSSQSCRNVPIMSLIGVTLGLNFDSLIDNSAEKMMSEMRELFQGYTWQTESLEKLPQSLNDLELNLEPIGNGCEGAVYMAKVKTEEVKSEQEDCQQVLSDSNAKFDLAVKAIFNYGAESNSHSILRELEREIVPLRAEGCKADNDDTLCQRVNRLPAHPNIVDMPGYFVDDMLVTEEGLRKFPAAMPRRTDPEKCFGRNKTLYLVMRRRSTHLRDYLANHKDSLTLRTRCLMLVQLLEGVSHLGQHGIAHRDLKTDNILVDVPQVGGPVRLEICDFGCCLAEEDKSLLVPFPSRDLYLGGNSFLMAPEIATASPGPDSVLDFRKSDLWAVAAIAYEIFGCENPFYPSKTNSGKRFDSCSYKESDLPPLPEEVPAPIQQLVQDMLSRDPSQRPSPSVAAAVVHLVILSSKTNLFSHGINSNNCLTSTPGKVGIKRMSKGGKPLDRKTIRKVRSEMSKGKQQLQWLLVQNLTLLCQLTFGNRSDYWNMDSVMTFLFLSRLTFADFQVAVKYF